LTADYVISLGYLGQITLVIPWSNLKSEPVKVIIDHIYLLAEPKNEATVKKKEASIKKHTLIIDIVFCRRRRRKTL
jgi:vacuolar protein sorting-associated protein 13A/C